MGMVNNVKLSEKGPCPRAMDLGPKIRVEK